MRPTDLAPTETLAAVRPHGHKMRYMAGCRCDKCRAGNAAYERKMQDDRIKYGPNDLVSSEEVRKHLLWLQTFGIGHKTVGRIAKVGKTSLSEILWHGKKLIRRRNANRVLEVQPVLENMPKTHRIDASVSMSRISQLTKWGIPWLLIARDGLRVSSSLQLSALHGKASTITVKNVIRIRHFYDRVVQMREIWTRLYGKIPSRHFVYWKPGRHGMTIRSFELRPFAPTYDFNHVYPAELKEAMRMNNRLKRAYRAKKKGNTNGKKHDARSAKSPLRDTRIA